MAVVVAATKGKNVCGIRKTGLGGHLWSTEVHYFRMELEFMKELFIVIPNLDMQTNK